MKKIPLFHTNLLKYLMQWNITKSDVLTFSFP